MITVRFYENFSLSFQSCAPFIDVSLFLQMSIAGILRPYKRHLTVTIVALVSIARDLARGQLVTAMVFAVIYLLVKAYATQASEAEVVFFSAELINH